jgi:hypothetical protein
VKLYIKKLVPYIDADEIARTFEPILKPGKRKSLEPWHPSVDHRSIGDASRIVFDDPKNWRA